MACRTTMTLLFTHFALHCKSDFLPPQCSCLHSGSKLVVTGTHCCYDEKDKIAGVGEWVEVREWS